MFEKLLDAIKEIPDAKIRLNVLNRLIDYVEERQTGLKEVLNNICK